MGSSSSKDQLGKQNVSHTQQFHPTTRKSASDHWNDIVKKAVEDQSDALFDVVIKQLREDTDAMLCNQPVSDLCFVLPRAKGNSKRSLFAKQLVNRYFTSTQDELGIRIQFNRLLARLADHHRQMEAHEFNEQTQFRQSRGNEFSNVWERIREDLHRPVGNIIQPGPQPLNASVAGADLVPLCEFLQSGSEILPNFFAKIVKTNVMKFPVGAVFTDGRLDLFKQNIGQDHIAVIAEALASSTKIKHVQLGNNFVSLVGATKLAELIMTPRGSTIETWYLGGNEFDRSCIDILCHALRDNTSCKSLWLKRNPIKPEGAVFLRRLLEENESIQLVDFQNTGLFDKGVATLFEGLCHNRHLRTLYLDANGITPEGVVSIANYFHYLCDTGEQGLTRIWLSMNRIGDSGCRLLLGALKGYTHLESLSIGSNGCSSEVARDIYECLVDSPSLKFLDLGMYKSTADLQELTNRIGDAGIAFISKLVAENKHLIALSVSCNGISNDGLKVLLEEGIQKSDSLIHVEYHQYGLKIDDELKKQIETKLELNWARIQKSVKTDSKYQYVRFVKHSPSVQYVDSIYK